MAGELILYTTEDGAASVRLRAEGGSVWVTQAEMAALFQTTSQNITLHVKAIYAEGELQPEATCKEHLQVRQEGGRQVRRALKHYNLDYAEDMNRRRKPMTMREWEDKLDAFLQFNERDVLTHAGKISAQVAERLGLERYAEFDARRREAERLAADAEDVRVLEQIERGLEAGNTGRNVR